MTEPVHNLPNVQEHYDQIVFEEYEFASYLRCPGASPVPPFSAPNRKRWAMQLIRGADVSPRTAPALVPYGLDARGAPNAPPPECALVIDSGFSFTHIVPILRGRVVSHAVRRCVGSSVTYLCPRAHNSHEELTLQCRWSFAVMHRIDVGGKLLTNYLKELVSFRHWYMMDQTSVMEHAKEKVCYVSTQWDNDWETAK